MYWTALKPNNVRSTGHVDLNSVSLSQINRMVEEILTHEKNKVTIEKLNVNLRNLSLHWPFFFCLSVVFF